MCYICLPRAEYFLARWNRYSAPMQPQYIAFLMRCTDFFYKSLKKSTMHDDALVPPPPPSKKHARFHIIKISTMNFMEITH